MQCARCQQENPPQAKFCLECGSSLTSQACAKCGTLVPTGAKFCPECGQTPQAAPSGPSVAADRRPAPAAEAERRQLTVMFCDLVGSTALSTRLDPEDLRDVVRAYQAACAEVIARFDGHIAQYLGDGLLVYFGYPKAHEDDAQRAVRAGLGIVEAVAQLEGSGDHRLAVRVGVHTGPVVVGQVGGGGRHEQLALGEAPNVAARLQALAEPDRVVISSTTHRLVDGFFTVRDLGSQAFKGVSTPIRAFEVIEESLARTRLDIVPPAGLTPLVGREQEVGVLLHGWKRAAEGLGQVVLLTGEPGIGKSRLVRVIKDRVAAGGHRRLECRCSPYYEHTPLYPVVDLLPRVFEWSRDESPEVKLAKLERGLTDAGLAVAEAVPLLASLLSLPPTDRYPLPPMSPARQKQKTLEAVLRFLLGVATREPVFLIVEDLHWVDPTTQELLTLLLDQIPTARLLALLTARPSFTVPWPARSHLNTLTLSRFTDNQTAMLVSGVTGDKTLPAEVLQQIVAKTDGVPLFVEELTKMVLESGLLRETGDHYELTAPLPPLAIPTTLQDSLMARLDRLAQVKEVAQLGATLGRTFSYELIRAVSALDEPTLRRELGRVVEAELVYQRGVPPDSTYLFKHALIQDAAYQSLLKSTRQQYHQRIAFAMIRQFPEETAVRPEFVAHHCTEAGLADHAISYWQQAGSRAVERSANSEALAHLGTALEMLRQLPATNERMQQELAAQTALGPALMATKGYASPAVERAYTRARELCERLGETRQLFTVLRGLWGVYVVRDELDTAHTLGQQCLDLAQRANSPGSLLWAHYLVGMTLFHRGEFGTARAHFTQGTALYSPQRRHGPRALQDPGVACLSYLGAVLWLLGYPDQAAQTSQGALTLAHKLSHPFSLAYALNIAASVQQFRQDASATRALAKEAHALCVEQGISYWSAWGPILLGWALTVTGETEIGLLEQRRGLTDYSATGAELVRPYFLALLAEAYAKNGTAELGLPLLAEALALIGKSKERWWIADVHRLHGELQLALSPQNADAAESCFMEALSASRQQQAKSLELRAALSLSRLWLRQRRLADARSLLTPVYAWFSEGFETADLKDAKAVLDSLA